MASFNHSMTSLNGKAGSDHREITQSIWKWGTVVTNNYDSVRAGVVERSRKLNILDSYYLYDLITFFIWWLTRSRSREVLILVCSLGQRWPSWQWGHLLRSMTKLVTLPLTETGSREQTRNGSGYKLSRPSVTHFLWPALPLKVPMIFQKITTKIQEAMQESSHLSHSTIIPFNSINSKSTPFNFLPFVCVRMCTCVIFVCLCMCMCVKARGCCQASSSIALLFSF